MSKAAHVMGVLILALRSAIKVVVDIAAAETASAWKVVGALLQPVQSKSGTHVQFTWAHVASKHSQSVAELQTLAPPEEPVGVTQSGCAKP